MVFKSASASQKKSGTFLCVFKCIHILVNGQGKEGIGLSLKMENQANHEFIVE